MALTYCGGADDLQADYRLCPSSNNKEHLLLYHSKSSATPVGTKRIEMNCKHPHIFRITTRDVYRCLACGIAVKVIPYEKLAKPTPKVQSNKEEK